VVTTGVVVLAAAVDAGVVATRVVVPGKEVVEGGVVELLQLIPSKAINNRMDRHKESLFTLTYYRLNLLRYQVSSISFQNPPKKAKLIFVI
jgi:hypothetical protein